MDEHSTAEMLRASWHRATRSPVTFGKTFYSRLFWVAPELRGMFSDDVAKQEQKLTDTLDFVLENADRLPRIMSELRAMAIRHVAYGTKAEHYDVVGDVLIWTLEHSLGPHLSMAEKEAWEDIYQRLATAMVAAAYPAP